jgi:predicted nucleic acid-binding protein
VEPAFVGSILDSTVAIAAERRSRSVLQILEQLKAAHGEVAIGLSVVTIVELTHGIQRAETEERRKRRRLSRMNGDRIEVTPAYLRAGTIKSANRCSTTSFRIIGPALRVPGPSPAFPPFR